MCGQTWSGVLYCVFVCISGEVSSLGDLHVRVQQFVFVPEGGSRSSAAVELPENLGNMVPSVEHVHHAQRVQRAPYGHKMALLPVERCSVREKSLNLMRALGLN